MDDEEFRRAGYAAIDRIIQYNQSLRSTPPVSHHLKDQNTNGFITHLKHHPKDQSENDFDTPSKVDKEQIGAVLPSIEPGYLHQLISPTIPTSAIPFPETASEIESSIMPGITHWQSPNFMAYFPANSSYPAILGDLYSDMFTCAAFNWQASPAVTELETIVLDMFADALGLDQGYKSGGEGGGVIVGTASEAVLTVMIAARDRVLSKSPTIKVDDLVVLISDQTHSGAEKAAKLLRIKCVKVQTTAESGYAMTGTALQETLAQLSMQALTPFFACVTLGTTAVCAIDDFESLTPIFERNRDIWIHLDAAYAGVALILPEYQSLLTHTTNYDSIDINAHKWLLTNFDCSCLWLRRRRDLLDAMDVTPSYLRNSHSDSGLVTDYRNWGIPLGRRFRALKLWFVFRTYGLDGLQSHVSSHIQFSKHFLGLVRGNPIFEVVATPRFALVVLRFVDGDEITKEVYERITKARKLFLTSAVVDGRVVIRVVAASPYVRQEHLVGAYHLLVETYHQVMREQKSLSV